MKPTARPPRVILRNCSAYEPTAIRNIVREALDELELAPFGRTLVKPNIVSSGELFRHAYTRPELVEGVLGALRDKGQRIQELAVGERCGITIPTRAAFEGANYNPVFKRQGVKRYCFEEEPQVEIPLTHQGRLRDYLFTPEPVARADFFVNCPKFKAHPWTTVTFSMKNYIGLQDDRHRLIDHDHKLNEKVADLQYIVQPQLIVIDAIIAGEGRMLTPLPRDLKLVILGNNQPAIDAVCCAIIGVDPREVAHIRLAHERGFGPIGLEHIELSGDVTLDEARARAKGFKVGLVRVEKYFEGSRITAYAGPPPESERTDYCWGGCPGAIEEAIEILRLFDQHTDEKMPRLHVVFGAYEGPIDARPGEKVVFIGDCAQWKGWLQGEDVVVESTYQQRSTKDPYEAEGKDIYARMIQATAKRLTGGRRPYRRMHGCPVSVMEQLYMLVQVSGARNPIFDQREIIRFNKAYAAWKATMAAKALRGHKYQVHGPALRGEAKPELE